MQALAVTNHDVQAAADHLLQNCVNADERPSALASAPQIFAMLTPPYSCDDQEKHLPQGSMPWGSMGSAAAEPILVAALPVVALPVAAASEPALVSGWYQ
jgi:hypothetical protein